MTLTYALNLTELKQTKKSSVREFGWDMGLDYDEIYEHLLNEIEKIRKKDVKYKNDIKRFAYLIILLTQLRNGSRIGEAVAAIMCFCSHMYELNWQDKIVCKVRVEKRKDDYFRDMVLPEEITKDDLLIINDFILELKKEYEKSLDKAKKEIDENKRKELERKASHNIVNRISTWAKKNLMINTHSLRYANIGKKAKEGVPAQIVAKITGHKNLDYIILYTQTQVARDILLNKK